MISWNDFEKLDIRVGTITHAAHFPEANKPAYQLTINFGETIGSLHSSAQITSLYTVDELINMQVIAVVNFPPKKIANFISECLILGIYNEQNEVVLLQPQQKVSDGLKIG
jgi:tRNA-binding protein